MKRVIFAVLLLSALAVAQTHKIPATDTNNTWTGTNKFNAGLTAGDTATAANGTISLTNASGTTTLTLDGTTGITAIRLNAVRFADQFTGADAGAKITAAIADLPNGGGTVDARGFGAGNQTISSTVTVGTSTKPVTLILNHATTFIPASAAVDMFSIGPNGYVSGLTVDVSGVTYTGKVVKFVGAFSDGMRGSLENFLIVGGGAGGTAVALVSSTSNQIVFAGVRHGRIVGFGRGLDLDAQGTSMYVNGNIFDDIEIKNAVVAIRLNAATGLQNSGNQFSNINLQYGTACTDAIVGSGLGEVSNNMFVNTNVWDYVGNYINFASTSVRNYFIGRADGTLADAGSQNTHYNIRGNGGLVQWMLGADHGLKASVVDGYGLNIVVGATEWKMVQSAGNFQLIKTGTGTPFTSDGINAAFSGKGTFNSGVQPASTGGTITWFQKVTHASLDLASVATAACTAAQTETITGAALGDRCSVASGIGTADSSFYTCNVTATDTAKWSYCNLSGAPIDRASDTYTIQVVR